MRPPLARENFDLEDGIVWVMHCAEGPVPLSAARAVERFFAKETQPWKMGWEDDFLGLQARLKSEGAVLLGVDPRHLSLTATTSSGLSTVAQGYPFEEGDEVLTPLGEFPANAWPWRALEARGVRLRKVPLWSGHRSGSEAWDGAPPPPDVEPEEAIAAAIGERTRLVSVSWVRFQDGLRLDLPRLAALCRARGVELVVDGIQGAGTLVPELEGIAAFATGGHKGLLAPQGLGLLYTSPAFREKLAPLGSWLSVEDATDFARPSTDYERAWADDGTRFELGVPNLVGAAALEASLAAINGAGVSRIAAHVDGLQRALFGALGASPRWAAEAARLEVLRERGRLGSIAALHHAGAGAEAWTRLLASGFGRGVHASVREGYLRVAFHGWHDEGDLEAVRAWLTGE